MKKVLLSGFLILGATLIAWSIQGGGTNLVANGDFNKDDKGWINQAGMTQGASGSWSSTGGRSGTGGLYLKANGGDPQMIAIYRYPIQSFPKGKALKMTLWVKGSNVSQIAGAVMQGWNEAGDKIVSFATTALDKPLKGTFDWTQVTATINPASDVAFVHVLLMVSNSGEAWFDDLSVTVEGESKPQDQGPAFGGAGLYEMKGEFRITPQQDMEEAKVFIPVPLSYREQVPISFKATVEPASSIGQGKFTKDKVGNYILEYKLSKLKKDQPLEFKWRSLVLASDRTYAPLPTAAKLSGPWPDEAKPWLKSTKSAQSDDPKIQAVAKQIRGNKDSVSEIIDATITKTTEIFKNQSGQCTNLDAVEALEKSGSCTSNANLVAALLRANGIPARILAGYPTWSGPLQTHYIVEAYVPGYGWYAIESTMLQKGWQPHGQLQVSIIPPENEDKSGARPWVAGGVPYLSLTEIEFPGQVAWFAQVDGKEYCDHVANRISLFKEEPAVWREALNLARSRWSGFIGGTKLSLNPPSKTGSLKDIISAMKG